MTSVTAPCPRCSRAVKVISEEPRTGLAWTLVECPAGHYREWRVRTLTPDERRTEIRPAS